MVRTWAVRAAALAALVSASSGCFRYVPAEIGPVPRGESVRMLVTPDGLAELRALSPEAGPTVTGTVMSWGDEGVMLRIPGGRGPTMVLGEAIGQDVRIPTRAIVQLERRRVDGLRTGLATGLAVAVIGTAIVTILSDAFGSEDLVNPGPDEQARIPLPAL